MAVEQGNLGISGIWDADSVGEGIGESAKAGAEDEAYLGAQCRAREDKLRGGIGENELIRHVRKM